MSHYNIPELLRQTRRHLSKANSLLEGEPTSVQVGEAHDQMIRASGKLRAAAFGLIVEMRD